MLTMTNKPNQEPSSSGNENGSSPNTPTDPEVVGKPKRRRYSAEYKLRIIEEAAACREPGALGVSWSVGAVAG